MKWRALLSASLALLLVFNVVVLAVLAHAKPHMLSVSFLDVGQGDAILIESPTGVQVLIDGGRDRSVLRELPKVVGVFDRSIDVVIESHPDADHIGGLPYVFDRYRIATYLGPAIPAQTPAANALAVAVAKEKGIEVLVAERGQRLALGGGAYLDVLFPDRSVAGVERNTGSVVVRVVYGDTSFVLSGDAPDEIENWLVALDAANPEAELDSDVLKAGHHGSNTSTSADWLSAVTPAFLVVSAGKDNSYGHPHQEVLERASAAGVQVLQTAQVGTIRFLSDGTTVTRK